tara:strand:+ start:139 stop:726 length:588 start_codon:yes stop_codon:yes gene_type:complete
LYINLETILILLTCYFVGSIPFGLLFSKLLSKSDPRLVGSKNIGATNIVRTSGWKLGLLTLIFDMLKSFIPVFILKNHLIEQSFIILFIFLGHLFPIWIRFKGGKGIAVIIGCLFGYNFFYGLIFSLVWLITAVMSKYSSLSALVASLSILVIIYLENDNIFLIILLMVIMIFLKHISNIRRLLAGNELRINLKK